MVNYNIDWFRSITYIAVILSIIFIPRYINWINTLILDLRIEHYNKKHSHKNADMTKQKGVEMNKNGK